MRSAEAVDDLLMFFAYSHLPPHLQTVSKPFHDLAHEMARIGRGSEEQLVALRKLLEAKDCMVRAALGVAP